MIFLSQIPFIRILLPFLIGIGFWLISKQDAQPLICIAVVYAICLFIYFLLIKKAQMLTKFLFGIAVQLFLFFSGWLVCNYANEKQNPSNYTHFLTEETIIYTGYVSEIPVEKTKSVKAEITL